VAIEIDSYERSILDKTILTVFVAVTVVTPAVAMAVLMQRDGSGLHTLFSQWTDTGILPMIEKSNRIRQDLEKIAVNEQIIPILCTQYPPLFPHYYRVNQVVLVAPKTT
jgi:hypothetical protein